MTDNKELNLFRLLFVIAALWNLTGAIFGYFFGRELTDPLIHAIYRGAWGTTFVYFFGYLIVARNPIKHTGIVIVGGIGKVGFAISLLQLYFANIASPVVLIVVVGDSIFMLFFFYYFYRLYKTKQHIL